MGGGVVLQRKAAGSRVSPMQGACSTHPTRNGSQFQVLGSCLAAHPHFCWERVCSLASPWTHLGKTTAVTKGQQGAVIKGQLQLAEPAAQRSQEARQLLNDLEAHRARSLVVQPSDSRQANGGTWEAKRRLW